ncbi:MAG: MBL fold metallo-hydrolase [Deltaproteobacteria bacterium]|nr:MBL fold metallo-hydrolase [Deltaproteobacteria bacterium]
MKTKLIRRGEWKTQLKKLSLIMLFCMMPVHCSARPPLTDKPHHTDDGFRNVHEFEEKGFLDFLKWRWERSFKEILSPDDYDFTPASNDPDFLRANRSINTVTWIGHATVLVQMAGKNILTDPHFSKRASPVQWAGPKRVVPPGIAMDQLPAIDMVVISHDHYDALDEQSIVDLHTRPGGDHTQFFVPLGLKTWFLERGIQRVVELDWWETYQASPLEVIAVPVQHWGKRSLFSRNQNLWAGWVILSPEFRFFFSGDTGYCPHFKAIGKRLGPFDLAAIPIGAYAPRWFMRNHHVNPEEALQIHEDIGSRKSVAIHWGTFILTDEPLDEPPERLKKALADRGLPQDEFMALKHGETLVLE